MEDISIDETKGVPPELLTKVRNKTLVEKAGPDAMELVIRMIIQGKNIPEIVKLLNQQYPDLDFTYDKVRGFIQKNHDITQLVHKIDWKLAKRHAEIRIDYHEEMHSVLKMAKDLLTDMKEEGAASADMLKGINTVTKTLLAHKKLIEGIIPTTTSKKSGDINVNIIQRISTEKQDIRSRILQAKTIIPETPIDANGESNAATVEVLDE